MVSKISILITTRNRAAFLSNLLESISLNTRSANQIIVEHILDYLNSPPHMYQHTYKTIIQNNFSYSNQLIEFINKCN